MKNILLTTAFAAILSLALASAPLNAQTPPTTPPAAAAKPAKSKYTNYSGTLTAIDATSITVTSTKKTLTMALSPTTTYEKDKKPATRADFAVGDKVTGSYAKDASGAMTAHSLHKSTKAAKKAATKSDAASTNAAPATPAAPASQ